MSTQTQNYPMGETLGKLLAGMILYREESKMNSQIQILINKGREWLGEDGLKEFINLNEQAQVAFIYACIDSAILGKESPETVSMLGKLDPVSKVFVEMSLLTMTGRNPRSKEERMNRWAEPLWNMKKVARKYIDLSPTKVKPEDVAQTFKEIAVSAMRNLREHVLKLV